MELESYHIRYVSSCLLQGKAKFYLSNQSLTRVNTPASHYTMGLSIALGMSRITQNKARILSNSDRNRLHHLYKQTHYLLSDGSASFRESVYFVVSSVPNYSSWSCSHVSIPVLMLTAACEYRPTSSLLLSNSTQMLPVQVSTVLA